MTGPKLDIRAVMASAMFVPISPLETGPVEDRDQRLNVIIENLNWTNNIVRQNIIREARVQLLRSNPNNNTAQTNISDADASADFLIQTMRTREDRSKDDAFYRYKPAKSAQQQSAAPSVSGSDSVQPTQDPQVDDMLRQFDAHAAKSILFYQRALLRYFTHEKRFHMVAIVMKVIEGLEATAAAWPPKRDDDIVMTDATTRPPQAVMSASSTNTQQRANLPPLQTNATKLRPLDIKREKIPASAPAVKAPSDLPRPAQPTTTAASSTATSTPTTDRSQPASPEARRRLIGSIPDVYGDPRRRGSAQAPAPIFASPTQPPSSTTSTKAAEFEEARGEKEQREKDMAERRARKARQDAQWERERLEKEEKERKKRAATATTPTFPSPRQIAGTKRPATEMSPSSPQTPAIMLQNIRLDSVIPTSDRPLYKRGWMPTAKSPTSTITFTSTPTPTTAAPDDAVDIDFSYQGPPEPERLKQKQKGADVIARIQAEAREKALALGHSAAQVVSQVYGPGQIPPPPQAQMGGEQMQNPLPARPPQPPMQGEKYMESEQQAQQQAPRNVDASRDPRRRPTR